VSAANEDFFFNDSFLAKVKFAVCLFNDEVPIATLDAPASAIHFNLS
jgi:hypothetical protein